VVVEHEWDVYVVDEVLEWIEQLDEARHLPEGTASGRGGG
jgi:hypothetical protein